MENLRQKLEIIANEVSSICVSISLNTHRTHPENETDRIVLKNLLREAENKIINIYGKREAGSVLDKLEMIPQEIDINYNLDGLHIFVSENTKQIIRTALPLSESVVFVGKHFAVQPLIMAVNRQQYYYILELSSGGVHLYEVLNDAILAEVKNEDFPFDSNPHYITHSDKSSDARLVDNMVREYFNKVDKALINVQKEDNLPVVVISTRRNFDFLKEIADKPDIYNIHEDINYNETRPFDLVQLAWPAVKQMQASDRKEAIEELKQAVSGGLVLTDLQEIYRAVSEGRGLLLIVNQHFSFPAVITKENSFEIVEDLSHPDLEKDIVSYLSRKMMSKGGRVVYIDDDNGLGDLGKIALMMRY